MPKFFQKSPEYNDRLSQIVNKLKALAIKNTIFEDDLNLEIIKEATLEVSELIKAIKLDKVAFDDLSKLLEYDDMPSMILEKISEIKQAFNNAPADTRFQSDQLINELNKIFEDKHSDYIDLVKEKIKADPTVMGTI